MTIFHNRTTAIFTTCVLLILSVIIGGTMSLNKIRGAALNYFYAGDGDGDSIQSDLTERINSSYNLVTIAERYTAGDANAAAAVRDVTQARDQLIRCDTVGQKYQANLKLTEATTTLHGLLAARQLSERDSVYGNSVYAELTSRNFTISGNAYNKKASEYNALLRRFPGAVLSLTGAVKPLELFQ